MRINSLGYHTDLFIPKYEGFLLNRGDYPVILTTTNPDYFGGNYLLFPNPLSEGDFKRWQELFTWEISSRDEHYFVARIHETLGVQPEERQVGLEWWERAVA
jgi:hypothetical protein